MSISPTIYGLNSVDILQGSTVSGTAPQSSYSLATVLTRQPDARVLFPSGSATITFTLGGSKEGAVLVVPVSNIAGAVASLTNGSGLNLPLTFPALPTSRIPVTFAYDFSASANRTASVWNLVITGNAESVVLGGAIAIYPKAILPTEFGYDIKPRITPAIASVINEYLTRYDEDFGPRVEGVDVTVHACPSGNLVTFRNWYKESCVATSPSLFFPNTPELEPLYGIWTGWDAQRLGDTTNYEIKIAFDELAKGKPL